jgi:hypothetical protein
MWRWLVRDWQWPAAALFAAVFLLALLPVFAAHAGAALALVFLQLPVYMIHQWEEHTGDRFRQYANRTIGGGREALTPAGTFWINSLGVWGVDLAALYLAWKVEPAAGLVAGYLAVVNAAGLLLPAGGWCVWQAGSECGWLPHVLGLASAVGVHVVVVGYVAGRLARLPKVA